MEENVIHYLDGVDNDWFRGRLKFFLFAVMLVFALLAVRLFYLQVLRGEEFKQRSKQNSVKFSRIYPSRGLIFDRRDKLLVENRPSFDLCVDITTKSNIEILVKKISSVTCLDSARLLRNFNRSKLSDCRRFIILQSNIDRQSLAAIRVNGYNLPGIAINVTSRRSYIYGSSLSHLIGYIGEIDIVDLQEGASVGYRLGDIIGKDGIERTKESELRGKCGGFWNQVNAVGAVVQSLDASAAVPGYNVTLTIDHDLQLVCESMLNGKMGALVAIDPSNGEVLAMASSPSYDKNIFVSSISESKWNSMISNPMKPFTNKAIQGQYPPASIYKIITAVAALEENVVDRHTKIRCHGFHMLGDRRYLCWKPNGHDSMDVVSALAESCDVFFYTLGRKLGVDCLARYARLFGLGVSSGIDLENEATGLVPTSDWKRLTYGTAWQPGETLSVAIGQSSNLVTPLQMAVMVSAIANGGKLHRPLVVKNVKNSSDSLCYESSPDVLSVLPLKTETIKTVQNGLCQAVKSDRGTARSIRAGWVEIAGKTGTAQIIGRGNCSDLSVRSKGHLADHAWFVGYAPAKDPKIALAVIVEHGGNGSKVAAPIGSRVIRHYLKGKVDK